MGKITEENRRKLQESTTYPDANLTDFITDTFAQTLDALIQKKGVSGQKISEITGISKSYINKLRRPSEKEVKPDRYKIINIGLALEGTEEEINALLKAANLQPLYARSQKESVIIWGLLHKKNYKEILELLDQNGFGNLLET